MQIVIPYNKQSYSIIIQIIFISNRYIHSSAMEQTRQTYDRTDADDRSITTQDGETADGLLIVIDPARPEASMREALPMAKAYDGEVHLLLAYPQSTYESRRRGHAQAGYTGAFSVHHLAYEAEGIAANLGLSYLGSEVEWQVHGAVGAEHHCVDKLKTAFDVTDVYNTSSSNGLRAVVGDARRWSTNVPRNVAGWIGQAVGRRSSPADQAGRTVIITSLL